MDIWLVGRYSECVNWEVRGIFDSEQKAIDACENTHDWIVKMALNESAKDTNKRTWEGFRYPKNS